MNSIKAMILVAVVAMVLPWVKCNVQKGTRGHRYDTIYTNKAHETDAVIDIKLLAQTERYSDG
jgi:hypothetical protein